MSKSVQIAKNVASALNTTVWDWPADIVPTTPDRLDTVLTVKTFVNPLVDREKTSELAVSVTPTQVEENDVRDTCGRTWVYQMQIAIYQTLQTNDEVQEQPATLDELDKLIGFAESIRDFCDGNRVIGGDSLRDLQLTLFNESLMTGSQFFLAHVTPMYQG